CSNYAGAQIKTGQTDLSKAAAKGTYSGTYKLDNGNVIVLYQSKDGASAFEFDANAKFVKEHKDTEAWNQYNQASEEERTTRNVQEAKEVKALDIIYTGRTFGGGMTLNSAKLVLNSSEKFI